MKKVSVVLLNKEKEEALKVKEVVETVFGIFRLRFGVHPRIGRNLDTVSVDFPHFLPVADVILLNPDNSGLDVIPHIPLRQCHTPADHNSNNDKNFSHNKFAAKIQKYLTRDVRIVYVYV